MGLVRGLKATSQGSVAAAAIGTGARARAIYLDIAKAVETAFKGTPRKENIPVIGFRTTGNVAVARVEIAGKE